MAIKCLLMSPINYTVMAGLKVHWKLISKGTKYFCQVLKFLSYKNDKKNIEKGEKWWFDH